MRSRQPRTRPPFVERYPGGLADFLSGASHGVELHLLAGSLCSHLPRFLIRLDLLSNVPDHSVMTFAQADPRQTSPPELYVLVGDANRGQVSASAFAVTMQPTFVDDRR
jgi:hypothetical protein